jgi:hypothetical protein
MRAALAALMLPALALAGPAARAADGLEQQVKALSEAVRVLQQRVDRLEGGHAPAAAPSPAPRAGEVTPEARLRMNWEKVGKDMDQGEVTRLLGAPSKKSTIDGRTVWYYAYPGTGGGSVFFTDAGRVSSRQSPFGWGW